MHHTHLGEPVLDTLLLVLQVVLLGALGRVLFKVHHRLPRREHKVGGHHVTHEEKVVVEQHKGGLDARDVVQVGLDGVRAKGGQRLVLVRKDVAVVHRDEARVVQVQPARQVLVYKVDVAIKPWHVLVQRSA